MSYLQHQGSTIIIRASATPHINISDGSGKDITVDYPRVGVWFGRLDVLNGTTNIFINFTAVICPPGKGGNKCQYDLTPVESTTQLLHQTNYGLVQYYTCIFFFLLFLLTHKLKIKYLMKKICSGLL